MLDTWLMLLDLQVIILVNSQLATDSHMVESQLLHLSISLLKSQFYKWWELYSWETKY